VIIYEPPVEEPTPPVDRDPVDPDPVVPETGPDTPVSDPDAGGDDTPDTEVDQSTSNGDSGVSATDEPARAPGTVRPVGSISSQNIVFGLNLDDDQLVSLAKPSFSRPMTTQQECVTASCSNPIRDFLDYVSNNIDDWQQAQIDIEQAPNISRGEKFYRVVLFSGGEILQFIIPENELELILLPAASLGKIVGGASKLRSIGISEEVIQALPPGRIDDATRLISAGPIRSQLSNSRVRFGGDIQVQGFDWENAIERTGDFGERLPGGFVAFDFYDRATRTAVSAKTLNTNAASYESPSAILRRIGNFVDATLDFSSSNRLAYSLKATDISSRKIELAVPADIGQFQNEAIRSAVLDAKNRGVIINVTYVQ